MNPEILEVSDGGFDYPRESLLPTDAGAEVLAGYPAVVAIPYRPLVIRSNGRNVLLDTGAGPLAPTTGRLRNSLYALGIPPEAVDVILLSHAHADHIGGLADDSGRPLFKNARILISRTEYTFWRDSGVRERLGSGSVYGNDAIETVIRLWLDKYLLPLEEELEFIDGESEVLPGVMAVPAPGHTPGQMAFLVTSSAEPLLFTADAISLADQVHHPEWTSSFDLDPQQTVATRRALLDRAAADDYRVAHYHVREIGHVRRRRGGFAWEPEEAFETTGS
jgi:glyoxylase-like metal-dependent hydrolase (beta-lactamase superfamily II)